MNYAEHRYGSDNLWKLVIFHGMLNVKTNKQLVKHYTGDYHHILQFGTCTFKTVQIKDESKHFSFRDGTGGVHPSRQNWSVKSNIKLLLKFNNSQNLWLSTAWLG